MTKKHRKGKTLAAWAAATMTVALAAFYARHVKKDNDNMRAACGESRIDRKLAKRGSK